MTAGGDIDTPAGLRVGDIELLTGGCWGSHAAGGQRGPGPRTESVVCSKRLFLPSEMFFDFSFKHVDRNLALVLKVL